jgi:hypothetical protein
MKAIYLLEGFTHGIHLHGAIHKFSFSTFDGPTKRKK